MSVCLCACVSVLRVCVVVLRSCLLVLRVLINRQRGLARPFGEVSSRCGSVLWLVAPSGVSLTSLAVLGRVIQALHDSIARLLRGGKV